MRLSRLSLVHACALAVLGAAAGCTGQIAGDETTPRNTGGGNGQQPPPVMNPPPIEVAGCSMGTLGKPRAWRLTHAQMKNTLLEGFNFSPPTIATLPPETRLDGFANQSKKLTIAPLLADYYLKASDELAGEVVRRAGELIPCPMTGLAPGKCLSDFIKAVGVKMWRRPVTDAEVTKLTNLYSTTAAQAGGVEAGVRNIVQAFFLSPNFLYRTEVGNTSAPGMVTYLTDYELASALSYMLWDGPPDARLMQLAGQGQLRDQKTLMAEAKRMWGANKTPVALHNFLAQWLQIEELPTTAKDQMMYPAYNMQVAADLMQETRLFLDSVVFAQDGDRSFRTLFTAPYGFVNSRTAPIYGIANAAGTNLTKTTLDGQERRGLLTLGAFMAAHADGDDTGLVSRGRYFREEILCDHVPPPDPADAVFDEKKIRPDMTNRERLEAHTTNPVCFTCHVLFDGLGFAMENYDPIGRFRLTDKNKMIDPTGKIPLPSAPNGPELEFANFIDLVDKLAKTPDLYSCFSSQYMSFATGRTIGDIHACERKLVNDEFVKSGHKVDTLVMSVVTSPSFMARKN